jgi:hypothetical protein
LQGIAHTQEAPYRKWYGFKSDLVVNFWGLKPKIPPSGLVLLLGRDRKFCYQWGGRYESYLPSNPQLSRILSVGETNVERWWENTLQISKLTPGRGSRFCHTGPQPTCDRDYSTQSLDWCQKSAPKTIFWAKQLQFVTIAIVKNSKNELFA